MHETILQSIGRTPLVQLRRVTEGLQAAVYVKVESTNPGGSIKDRVAVAMIQEAERQKWLQPGGTIIEATAGNTGLGLAMAAAVKGYRCIFVLPDKMSADKIRLLKAYGAEVIITATNVPPDSPESYNGVADRLSREIPGAWRPNQFTNMANPDAHYHSTGPEIWEQTEGKITVFVRGHRHGRHHHRRGQIFERAQFGYHHCRCRPRRFGAVRRQARFVEGRRHRRRFCAQDVQQPSRRRLGARQRCRVVLDGPRARPARRPPRRRQQPARRRRRHCATHAGCRRNISSSRCAPTPAVIT